MPASRRLPAPATCCHSATVRPAGREHCTAGGASENQLLSLHCWRRPRPSQLQTAPDPPNNVLASLLCALQSPRSRSSPRRRARRQASACRLAASAPAIADTLGCGGCAGHTPMQPIHSSGLVPARGTSCIALVSPPPWGPACLPHPALVSFCTRTFGFLVLRAPATSSSWPLCGVSFFSPADACPDTKPIT